MLKDFFKITVLNFCYIQHRTTQLELILGKTNVAGVTASTEALNENNAELSVTTFNAISYAFILFSLRIVGDTNCTNQQ